MSTALCGHRAALFHSYRTAWSSSPASSSVVSWRQHRGYDLAYSKSRNDFRGPNSIFLFSACSHCRYASSSSKRRQRQPPSSSTTPSSIATPSPSSSSAPIANEVNPPPSTRPADLNLPDPLPSYAPVSDKLKRYIAVGRAYITFYKTGLKNVYHNYRDSVPLRRSLAIPAYLPISPPPSPKSPRSNSNTAFYAAVKSTNLTRSNFQLVHRAAHDVRRIIPFSILLIVCGELTPLVVLALGNAITPFTCRVPKQIEKTRSQKTARKRAALIAHQARTTGSVTPVPVGSDEELDFLAGDFTNPDWITNTASAEDILGACAVLGLCKTHLRAWPGLVPVLLYRPRLLRYAAYLRLDDELIRKAGGVKGMDAAEVRIAIEERGGVDVAEGRYGWEAEREERRWLERWLTRTRSG